MNSRQTGGATVHASGLPPKGGPHEEARYQLDRVAGAWARDVGRDVNVVRGEIENVLQGNVHAPFGGLVGVDMINVLEVNLALRQRYGEPPAPAA